MFERAEYVRLQGSRVVKLKRFLPSMKDECPFNWSADCRQTLHRVTFEVLGIT